MQKRLIQFAGKKQDLLEVATVLKKLPETMHAKHFYQAFQILEASGNSPLKVSAPAVWRKREEYMKSGLRHYQSGEKVWSDTIDGKNEGWTAWQAFAAFCDYPANSRSGFVSIIGQKKRKWETERQRQHVSKLFSEHFFTLAEDYVKIMHIDLSKMLKLVAKEMEDEAKSLPG